MVKCPSAAKDKLLKLACLQEYFSLPDCAMETIEYGQKNSIFNATESAHYLAAIGENIVTRMFNRTEKP
jgi:hypothetical protein